MFPRSSLLKALKVRWLFNQRQRGRLETMEVSFTRLETMEESFCEVEDNVGGEGII